MLVPLLIIVVVGYLLGSLPFGWIVARARGVNIFEVGSKSPGATNVRRNLGAAAGNLVFALDTVKGALAAGLPLLCRASGIVRPSGAANGFMEGPGPSALPFDSPVYCVAGLVAALVGHSFSCFTRFRGGKGVATGTGGFLVLMPAVTLVAVFVWVSLFYSTRYVSLASIAAVVSMPIVSYFHKDPALLTAMAAAIAIFVTLRHRSNIGRLLKGTEHRACRKSEECD